MGFPRVGSWYPPLEIPRKNAFDSKFKVKTHSEGRDGFVNYSLDSWAVLRDHRT